MKELNNIFLNYIEKGFFPGIQWQINIKDKVFKGKVGFNNIDSKDPIKENTIYRIWSMTKPIIAITALQLIEEKKFNLNDPIDKYLSEFLNLKVLKTLNSKIDEVEDLKIKPTIKDLLLHTAGFSYNFLDDPIGKEYEKIMLFNSSTTTLEKEINKLSKIPLLFRPQSNWRYSVSMDVLGRIIEVIENNSLQNILKKRIFDPLEMHETNFSIPIKNNKRLMKSYEFDPFNLLLKDLDNIPQKIGNYGYPLHEINYARGGHGLFSTISDYSKFATMLKNGKTLDGKTLINDNSLKLISKNALDNKLLPIEILSTGTIKDENYKNDLEAYGWGLGFRTLIDPNKNNNLGSVGEFGWAGAASTYFLVDRNKDMIALLMTQVLSGDPKLKNDFYKYIYNYF